MLCNESTDNSPSFYPIGLNLSDKTVLMAGAGKVAARKLERLTRYNCKIVVISPNISEECSPLMNSEKVTFIQTAFQPEHLIQYAPHLVFACTSSPEANRNITQACEKQGIWVNSATEGTHLSDFIVPAVSRYDDLQVALFSGGASPLLLKKIREDFEARLGPWIGPYLSILKALRQELQTTISDEQTRQQCYKVLLGDEQLLQEVQQNSPNIDALAQAALRRVREQLQPTKV